MTETFSIETQNNIQSINYYDCYPVEVRCFCFVCFGVFVPLENFSLIWRRHHYRWRAENVDLCSALMAIEQWGFFNVPHLLWNGASVYNGHLRGPVTLTPIAERLAVGLSLSDYDLALSLLGFEHPIFHLQGERSNPLRHRRVSIYIELIHNLLVCMPGS